MEKLQLCLDDEDELPMCKEFTAVETKSTDCKKDGTPEPDLFFEFAASAHSDLNQEIPKWYNHDCNEKIDICDSLVASSNAELLCKDNVSVGNLGRRVDSSSSSFQKSTKLNTQDTAKANSSSAQDLFWASMLQAQLCVLDLQDELEKQEKHKDIPEMSLYEISSSQPYLDSSTTDLVHDRAEEDLCLEESSENYETFYSEEEVEDESLFCDNPIFNNAQQITCSNDLITTDNGTSQIDVQPSTSKDILDNPNSVLGHQITHTESLEILQIFEDDFEEREALSGKTTAPKWPVYDIPQSPPERICHPEDVCSSAVPSIPRVSPSLKTDTEEEGLLFSPCNFSLVTALLEDDSQHNYSSSSTCMDNPTTPQTPEQPQDEWVQCYDVPGARLVCQGCKEKEPSSRLESELKIDEAVSTQQQDFLQTLTEPNDSISTDMETSCSEEVTYVEALPNNQDLEAAKCLAMRLYQLDGFERSQVAPYLQKNNDFSSMVAEEYLSLFDFTGKTLDASLRCLLQELVLTGETQERERVLFHFSKRFHMCNPKDFSSADAVHTLTCALMLLNSDLHGQNIGKSMTQQDFINNLDGMNDGDSFSRELLKAMYHSIRNEKLEWAMSEETLTNVLVSKPENVPLTRKKSNPFLDVPCPDPQAPTYKQGMLCRKVHADIDGKKTPWGKRGWKSFYTLLKGMLMIFLKDEYRSDLQCPEEVISVHHALAERASEYTKRPHVFRLQTADWRVFLFQAQTSEEMNSWIARINLVAAMFSSPPFPAAIGSQKRFVRPILPSAPCKRCLEEQLQSHESWMDTFTDDLTEHQRNLPDSKSKARDWEDYHLRGEYLRFEKSRYETYVKLLALRMQKGCEDLSIWESLLVVPNGAEEDSCGLKRSHSSPSLNPESSPMVIKVKRNISERRTYRRIIPKRNKNLA